MRFRPRPTPTELVNTTNITTSQSYAANDSDIPLKAQSFLGTQARKAPTPAPRINTPEPLRELLATHDSDLRAYTTAPDSSNDTTPTTAPQLMPWPAPSYRPPNVSNTDLRSTSNSSGAGAHRNGPSRNDSGQSVQPQQFYSEQKQSSDPPRQGGYYEAATQPLYVSQQTSASAVRDMALRKGSPTVQEIASQPQPAGAKPLKSAMKQPKLQKDPSRARQPKKLDISSLFPQSRSSPVSAKYSHTPSPQTEANEFFPRETVRAQVRRQGPDGRFETYKELVAPSTESLSASRMAPRVKIFDADVYDETKLHKRRPPKGIQNWFDGFDISSDEEERTTTAELPAETPLQSPSVQYSNPLERPPINHRHSLLVPQEPPRRANSRPQPNIRGRPQRAHSSSSTLNGSVSSAALADGHKRHLDSRLAHSQLDTESVLNLSSDSDVERRDLSPVRDSRLIEKASATVLQRPTIPPRKVHSKTNLGYDETLRKSSSTAQTSGSIPIRLTDSMEVPPLPLPRSSVTSPRESEYPPSLRVPDSNAPSSPKSSHRQIRNSTSKPPSRGSATAETTSSVPTDAAHLMAVTDEEMMLLDMMRQKRAAMAKNSFAEGYRLALQQEEEHLARKRISGRGAAVRMLKAKEREKEREREKETGEEGVGAGGEIPQAVRREKNFSMSSEEARERRMRYSMIRKGSVDKNFRLGRFLAIEAAAAAAASSEDDIARGTASPPPATLARLERFLVMKPSLLDAIQDPRPMSGTEIETETMTETEGEGTFDEDYTVDEDDELDERGRIVVPGAPSPMQRLTEMVRGSPTSPLPTQQELELEAELRGEEAQDGDDARRQSVGARTLFTRTTSGSASQNLSTGEFPIPPVGDGMLDGLTPRGAPEDGGRDTRLPFSISTPADFDEEQLVPDVPTRHPNRSPLPEPEVVDGRTPTTTTAMPYPTPPSPTNIHLSQHYMHQPQHHAKPHRRHPKDSAQPSPAQFFPLDPPNPLRSHPIGSPSLSTSRASPLTSTFTPPSAAMGLGADVFTSNSADRERGVKYLPIRVAGSSSVGAGSGSEGDGGSSFRDAIYSSSPDVNGGYPAIGAFGRGVPAPGMLKGVPPVVNGILPVIQPLSPIQPLMTTRPEPSRKLSSRKPPPPRLETQQPGAHLGVLPSAPSSAQYSGATHSDQRTPSTAGAGRTPGTAELQRMASLSSITSAGEDVLAAWAELGGGGEYLLRSAGGGGWAGERKGW